MKPSYLSLYETGRLKKITSGFLDSLESCQLCPRNCQVNRKEGQTGFCHIGRYAKVNSFFLHFGEERELVGRGGSGTIFFSYCNLGCIYCQNYSLSHWGEGKVVSPYELAQMMVSLQAQGAENINFVTPTHVIVQILEGLDIAISQGLRLPLVYNCGGYEKMETLRLLEGIFDIYMPDIKYSHNEIALKYSQVPDYWEVVREAVKEMHRQVGDLVVEKGVALRGLLIRHLLLPHRLGGSFEILKFIKEEISPHTYVNIMAQYYPCFEAGRFKELSRRISREEYEEVIREAKKIGLSRGF